MNSKKLSPAIFSDGITYIKMHLNNPFVCFWQEPITRRQNSRLVQIETNCRHFKAHLK